MPKIFPLLFLCVFVISCGRKDSENTSSTKIEEGHALSAFQQHIETAAKALTAHPSENLTVPVSITNPGPETWVSLGRYPITVSYKWFEGGQMLPIEGARTLLPAPLGPHQTININAKVIAPDQPGSYTLRISLVQEGVAWFMQKGGSPLELSVSVN